MGAISLINYSFTYPGETMPALKDVTLDVAPGEFIVVCGETGSGKTTLLRTLKPEIAPVGETEGTLKLSSENAIETSATLRNDVGAAALTRPRVGMAVGFVSQDPEAQVVMDTARAELAFGLENLGIEPGEIRRRVAEVATFFGIDAWIDRHVHELSGGQKQILNVASALVMQPTVLVLDEPTAQLDPIATREFLNLIECVNTEVGIAVVMSTHNVREVLGLATKVVVMEKGGTLRCLPPQEFTPPAIPARSQDRIRTLGEEPALTAKRLWFRYDRTRDFVLREVLLKVNRGEIHALLGGNGGGKTTLLSLIAGILTPSKGKASLAQGLVAGMLPQDPKTLFATDTVYGELAEWRKLSGYSEEDIEEQLERFGLAQIKERHPYDLSGGEAQKLALAKVLLLSPDILLLDEPTKGIDTTAKGDIAVVLLELADAGVTILMATHDLEFTDLVADRCSLLFGGEIVSSAPTNDFFDSNLFYTTKQRRAMKGFVNE